MTPSCENQDCGYRVCCFYCEAQNGCPGVCSNVSEYIENGTNPKDSECESFVDDEMEG